MVDAGGQRWMLDAYLLIQTEVGRAGPAAAIRAIDGVQWVMTLRVPTTSSPGSRRPGWMT
jgi:predicted ATP-grasp superfamily ATP-dependent carboligase